MVELTVVLKAVTLSSSIASYISKYNQLNEIKVKIDGLISSELITGIEQLKKAMEVRDGQMKKMLLAQASTSLEKAFYLENNEAKIVAAVGLMLIDICLGCKQHFNEIKNKLRHSDYIQPDDPTIIKMERAYKKFGFLIGGLPGMAVWLMNRNEKGLSDAYDDWVGDDKKEYIRQRDMVFYFPFRQDAKYLDIIIPKN